MNFKKLKAKIEEIGLDRIADGDFNVKEIDKSFKKSDFKVVHESERYDGNSIEMVFKHTDAKLGDIYVKLEGYYSSYEGTDWDTVSKVKPHKETVTVYK